MYHLKVALMEVTRLATELFNKLCRVIVENGSPGRVVLGELAETVKPPMSKIRAPELPYTVVPPDYVVIDGNVVSGQCAVPRLTDAVCDESYYGWVAHIKPNRHQAGVLCVTRVFSDGDVSFTMALDGRDVHYLSCQEIPTVEETAGVDRWASYFESPNSIFGSGTSPLSSAVTLAMAVEMRRIIYVAAAEFNSLIYVDQREDPAAVHVARVIMRPADQSRTVVIDCYEMFYPFQ
jgi:hypothetical protein